MLVCKAHKVHRLACRGCPNQGTLGRAKRSSVKRYANEELLLRVENDLNTEKAKASLRQLKYWPETVYAEMKGPQGLCRLTLRGNMKAHIQVLLALAAHNIISGSWQKGWEAIERNRNRHPV
ncbi:MAG TPA: hypothetical protein GXX39_04260 [Syntrophothermus lipocalidus]|nr:hypothetical protein [Syntrophothermus lipocalidus]